MLASPERELFFPRRSKNPPVLEVQLLLADLDRKDARESYAVLNDLLMMLANLERRDARESWVVSNDLLTIKERLGMQAPINAEAGSSMDHVAASALSSILY